MIQIIVVTAADIGIKRGKHIQYSPLFCKKFSVEYRVKYSLKIGCWSIVDNID
jgi:hypothetical protein